MSDTGCKYCGETWEPLFRIIETYQYNEIDVHGECENCEEGADMSEAVCDDCEFAPIPINNQLNLTIYINGNLGEIVFEDKIQQCQKYHKLISFCPMCGREFHKETQS